MARKILKSKLRMGSAGALIPGASPLSKRPLVPYSLLASSNPLFHPPHSPSAGSEWAGGKKGADADERPRVAADDAHQRRRPFFRQSAPH